MARRFRSALRRPRGWRPAAALIACAAIGALAAAMLLPRLYSAASVTALSAISVTGTDVDTGSTASSADAPGGAKTGAARPGDTLSWTVSYQNGNDAPASVSLTDSLAHAGAYVPGSLVLPPSNNAAGAIAPRYSTNGGATWSTGTPPAGSTDLGFTASGVLARTQQASAPFVPATPPNLSVAGGDAYNAVVYSGLVYAIWHHSDGPFVYCSTPNGDSCPGWPAGVHVQSWSGNIGTRVGSGSAFHGRTAQQNGTWLTGSRMYWYLGTWDNSSVGVACLELATTPPTSCGYSAVPIGTAATGPTLAAMIGGTGLPASDGNTWASAVGNNSAYLVCITPSAGMCGQIRLISGVATPNVYASAAFGNHLFASIQQTTSSSWLTYCYNLTTKALCTGAWPIATSPSSSKAGTPFAPRLAADGTLTGICTLTNGPGTSSSCWSLTAALQSTNPYSGTGAAIGAGGNGSGDVYVVGATVYAPAGDTVTCLDFARYSGTGTVPTCAGFSKPANRSNYSSRPATDFTPDCMVAAGDGAQITFYDRLTGKACIPPTSESVKVTPESYYCATGSASLRGWQSLALSGLTWTDVRSVSITLTDQSGAVVPGWKDRSFSQIPSLPILVSISDVPSTVTALTAAVTLIGATDVAKVRATQIVVTWSGDPPQMCFQTIAPPVACDAPAPLALSNTATATTTSAAGSDAPKGNTSGAAVFSVTADTSQCSLAIAKTSPLQEARPGARIDYEIVVRNTGTQAYAQATMTDDLTDVLTEATFGNDQKATSGTLTFVAPMLRWSGPLAAGASARITYSVLVANPDTGDHTLLNTVVSPSRGANCAAGSPDPSCTATVTVAVADATWRKVDATSAANVLAGSEWRLTPVDDAGRPSGAPVVVVDCTAADAAGCTGADIDPIGGLFRVTGLGPGSYQLVETRAPAGFLLDARPVRVVIGAAETAVTLSDIVNRQLPVPAIPFTGGIGTDTLTIGGGGALAASAVLGLCLLRRRRMERS